MNTTIRIPSTFGRSLLVIGLGGVLAVLPTPGSAVTPAPQEKAARAGRPDTAAAGNTVKLTDKEVTFLQDAGRSNVAEIQLAELALKNGQSTNVKTFALETLRDRIAANRQLSVVARQHAVVDFPPQVPAKEKAFYDRMAKLHGELFDQAYLKHVTLNHADDMAESKKAVGEMKDHRLKEYANRIEPMVEGRHQEAGGIKAEMDKQKS